MGDPRHFEEAYTELRGCHVLARVEGHNGERWAMHRLVRDFGRARLGKADIGVHAFSLADWLTAPSVSIQAEVPHFVSAILEATRAGLGVYRRGRSPTREIGWRSGTFLNAGIIDYFREEIRDPKSVRLILDGLVDVNDDVRRQAVELLERVGPIPEVLDGLAAALADPDPRVRENASRTIARRGPRMVAILTRSLSDSSVVVRRAAVSALVGMGGDSIPALVKALADSDSAIRIESACSLAERKVSAGVAVLLELEAQLPAPYLARVASALGASRDARCIPMLIRLLSREEAQEQASQALVAFKASARQALEEMLKGPDRNARFRAARLLCKLKAKAGIAFLTEVLPGLPEDEREAALNALDEARAPLPMAALLLELRSGGWRRQHAIKRVGETRDKAGITPLRAIAAGDEDQGVRSLAAEAIARIGGPEAQNALLSLWAEGSKDRKESYSASLVYLASGCVRDPAPKLHRWLTDEIRGAQEGNFRSALIAVFLALYHDHDGAMKGKDECAVAKAIVDTFGNKAKRRGDLFLATLALIAPYSERDLEKRLQSAEVVAKKMLTLVPVIDAINGTKKRTERVAGFRRSVLEIMGKNVSSALTKETLLQLSANGTPNTRAAVEEILAIIAEGPPQEGTQEER